MKLLVTDMDGTFLNSKRQIPQENIDAVLRLKEAGIPTIICTGRPVSFVGEYVQQSGVASTVIGCNGAVIADVQTGDILYYAELEPDTVRNIANFCLEREFDVCAYNESGVVYFSDTSKRVSVFQVYNEHIAATKSSVPKVPLVPLEKNISQFFDEHVCKFLVTANDEEDLPTTWEFLRSIKNIYAVPSMSNVIDVMAEGVSKGKGVERLSELMQIPLSEICVVGDNKNDIPMFQAAGTSVCMANGDEEAKKSAAYVTSKTNDNGGFAEAVQFAINN